MSSLRERLSAEVPAASLAAFRVLFGLACAFASIRFVAMGWVDELLVAPAHHLHYAGFGFVIEPPRGWLYALFATMTLSSLAIAVGLFHRAAAAIYFLAFTYVELIDQALYLNHYYAVSLIACLLVFLPLGEVYSLDARRRGTKRTTLPAYVLYAIRAQLGVVYFFAGVAKIHPDWMFRAEPLATWLQASLDTPFIGWTFTYPFMPFAMSWAGLAFDLTVPFFLSARRTRPFAYAAVVVFHLVTGAMFNIGLFPLYMIAFTPVFFEPDWPLRLLSRLRRDRGASEVVATPVEDGVPMGRVAFVGLTVWFAIQILVPLRHFVMPGDRLWTYEGFNFAWHVMLVEKGAHADLVVLDRDTGVRTLVEPDDYYTPMQIRAMSEDPALVVQFAHLVAEQYRGAGHPRVAVFARSYAALNGRAAQPLVDPSVDLTTIGELTPASRYVVPLYEDERYRGFSF